MPLRGLGPGHEVKRINGRKARSRRKIYAGPRVYYAHLSRVSGTPALGLGDKKRCEFSHGIWVQLFDE